MSAPTLRSGCRPVGPSRRGAAENIDHCRCRGFTEVEKESSTPVSVGFSDFRRRVALVGGVGYAPFLLGGILGVDCIERQSTWNVLVAVRDRMPHLKPILK